MKHDYTKLDEVILASIRDAAPIEFTNLFNGKVADEALALEKAASGHGRGRRDDKPAWRFIDARLQSLRKRGKIKSTKQGWVLA